METPAKPVKVWYSFAEADASLLAQLETHLSLLRNEGMISTWHRHQIIAGHEWQRELAQYLDAASLILLLVSPDFLASTQQYEEELQRAMQRHRDQQTHVIPILLRPCDWESAPFAKLQALPRSGKAITLWPDQDAAFTLVTKEIRTVLTGKPPTTSLPAESIPRTYHVQITEGKGMMIDDSTQVTTSSAAPPTPLSKQRSITITRLKALLSAGRFRGKGIHLKDIMLFGSRIDIDA